LGDKGVKEQSHLRHGKSISESFQEFLHHQFQKSPWACVSMGLHALIGLFLWTAAFSMMPEEPAPKPIIVSEKPIRWSDDNRLRDVFDRDFERNPDDPPSDDPELTDTEISDHNEEVIDEEMELEQTRLGDQCVNGQGISDTPFQGRYWNSALGLGSGNAGPFSGRYGGMRNLRAYGGGRRTESCVGLGQGWLHNHQNPDGSWSCDRFNANCKKGSCTGTGASPEHDLGVTGLSLLAFLGAGHTHRHGRFKRTVKRALKALKARQGPEGRFGSDAGDGHWIYNHLICALAASEAYGLSRRSPVLRGMAQNAVDYAVKCQNPGLGWRYGEQPGDSDTSCTAWAVLALKSARLSGLDVPKNAFDGADAFLDKMTDKETFKVSYAVPGTGDARRKGNEKFMTLEAMTAAAVLSRLFMGTSPKDPKVALGGARLGKCLPIWDVSKGTIDMYYWYYGTLAAFQIGGKLWKTWNPALKNALVPTQRRMGCENGSWDPVGAWGAAGGRVYATAINVLTLEVYYRYGRVLRLR
jgi:hypothetical protein